MSLTGATPANVNRDDVECYQKCEDRALNDDERPRPHAAGELSPFSAERQVVICHLIRISAHALLQQSVGLV